MSEQASKISHPRQHAKVHFGNESSQAITHTATDKYTPNKQENTPCEFIIHLPVVNSLKCMSAKKY